MYTNSKKKHTWSAYTCRTKKTHSHPNWWWKHTHTQKHTHTYSKKKKRIHSHIYAHIRTHTHAHAHTHIHTWTITLAYQNPPENPKSKTRGRYSDDACNTRRFRGNLPTKMPGCHQCLVALGCVFLHIH